MKIHRVRSLEEYDAYLCKNKCLLDDHLDYLGQITPDEHVSFTVPGYSYTAGEQVSFLVDFQHSGGSGRVNWRESVCCPKTHFNNRMRATFHLSDIEMDMHSDSHIYLTEQVTPIYKYYKSKYANVIGSEYFGSNVPGGMVTDSGVRNEDLCALSFNESSFDSIISLDVLEHIPNYTFAFHECFRVLKNGGKLMWSVPFIPSIYNNLIRAKLIDGQVQHLQTPEYHGDPMSGDGILCYQHFGWEMLDQVRASGFRDAYAICFHSIEFGYLGGVQFMFFAVK